MQTFFKKYRMYALPWVIVLILLAVTYAQHRHINRPIPAPPVDNRIDSLQCVVEKLNADLMDARHNYDSAQANIKTNIVTIRLQNAQDVSNISNFSTEQLDSSWSAIPFP
jgi:hypothetical protein